MFKKFKTIEDKCDEFKEKALALMKKEDLDIVLVELVDFEKFFSYEADKIQTSWLPRRVWNYLKSINVNLRKQRSKNMIEVRIVGENSKK